MFHGSYNEDDVTFLLKPVELTETGLLEKEKLIQSGQKHYSEMISIEYAPSSEYLEFFYKALQTNKEKMAKNILALSEFLKNKKDLILVSLARAGTPVGVLLKRTLRDIFDRNVPHYSISIIRDRGIDQNALKYILQKSGVDTGIVFIDGWTGKGVISRELKDSVRNFNKENNCNISADLCVLSDISGKAAISVTSEDYLIPSSVLNSTISGLVSRSILNESIGPGDFHGCKFYAQLKENDLSVWFIDTMMAEIKKLKLSGYGPEKINTEINPQLQQISDNFIRIAMEKYNIRDINYIKPGIGETTRVLLRRVPDKILVKNLKLPEIAHLLVLAREKDVLIEEINDMPYKTVGVISDLER
jgi:hypothetical protein